MQLPLLSGVYTDNKVNVRTAYPVNMVPVPKSSGVSELYLKPADGIVQEGTGPGVNRGGINWDGVCYRVMGTKLVSVNASGVLTTLGDVGSGGPVTMDYSFDRLGVASGGKLYYWDGTTLTQVVDVDLGLVIDFVFIDGYFLTTDGEFLVVTELNNPLSVDPLKYGSSEVDPDPVVGVEVLRNEVYALNRYTIEVFNNVGGDNFPFARVDGAQIMKGSVGTHAACVFADAIAFIGGGRNEAISIYLGGGGQAVKIATSELDVLLANYSDEELAGAVLEARVDEGHNYLYVHLSDRALVYDSAASKEVGAHVWHILTSSVSGYSQYRARYFVRCYNKWLCGDPSGDTYGRLSKDLATHYGAAVRWEFSTVMVYAGGKNAVIHDLELISITGEVALGANPTVSTSYSTDGRTWSQDRFIFAGKIGNREKRIKWLQQGMLRKWRIQRFQGTSDARIGVLALEATIEAMAY